MNFEIEDVTTYKLHLSGVTKDKVKTSLKQPDGKSTIVNMTVDFENASSDQIKDLLARAITIRGCDRLRNQFIDGEKSLDDILALDGTQFAVTLDELLAKREKSSLDKDLDAMKALGLSEAEAAKASIAILKKHGIL